MRKEKGFTLIELMIVVFVVGSLASFIVPMIKIQQSINTAEKQSVKTMEMIESNSPTMNLRAR